VSGLGSLTSSLPFHSSSLNKGVAVCMSQVVHAISGHDSPATLWHDSLVKAGLGHDIVPGALIPSSNTNAIGAFEMIGLHQILQH